MRQSIIKGKQKQCGHCKKMKTFSKFTKDNRAKCGLKSECDKCRAESRKNLENQNDKKLTNLKNLHHVKIVKNIIHHM